MVCIIVFLWVYLVLGLSRSNSLCSSFNAGTAGVVGSTREDKFEEGDRVIVAGYRRGTVRFIGQTKFATGLSNTAVTICSKTW